MGLSRAYRARITLAAVTPAVNGNPRTPRPLPSPRSGMGRGRKKVVNVIWIKICWDEEERGSPENRVSVRGRARMLQKSRPPEEANNNSPGWSEGENEGLWPLFFSSRNPGLRDPPPPPPPILCRTAQDGGRLGFRSG